MTNLHPLLEKYEELYNPKKEEPKKVEYEPDPEFVKQLENKSTLPTDPTTKKLSTLVSYDIDDGRDSFLQVAEKIKKGEAKVSSMSMEIDIMKGTSITFEVRVWDT
jgi:hypothetical protein